ncbi:hypothetical protein EYF80_032563 [Liparis tanakae]|uniref:Uncharacterized protein n=1 Tax=Liparis tanakae TaxID=230148 RepID=A0A4Z2GUV9_9TELE|nr:hypothetical protein EYF80_032563 [Liparis tanakae]
MSASPTRSDLNEANAERSSASSRCSPLDVSIELTGPTSAARTTPANGSLPPATRDENTATD